MCVLFKSWCFFHPTFFRNNYKLLMIAELTLKNIFLKFMTWQCSSLPVFIAWPISISRCAYDTVMSAGTNALNSALWFMSRYGTRYEWRSSIRSLRVSQGVIVLLLCRMGRLVWCVKKSMSLEAKIIITEN